EGELPSHFGAAPASGAEGDDATDDASAEKRKPRVLVAGSAGIVRDDFLNQANAALVLNIVDWLLLDPALLGMRTRGLIDPPLEQDLPDSTRNLVKYGNAVGVPLLLVLYGLVRWRLRET